MRTIQQLHDLQGRTALVTGGSRGLGLQMAHALGEAGARVMLCSHKADDLEQDYEQPVLAHLPGRGRLEGRMGALRVRNAQGHVFDLGSGFSDAERAAPPPLGALCATPNLPIFARKMPAFTRARFATPCTSACATKTACSICPNNWAGR